MDQPSEVRSRLHRFVMSLSALQMPHSIHPSKNWEYVLKDVHRTRLGVDMAQNFREKCCKKTFVLHVECCLPLISGLQSVTGVLRGSNHGKMVY
eukprot:m.1055690 g.1055690  ORF g.1055690 m.1055690 type:complete len:94 (-) comp24194_c0_seq10:3237-3518(-)